MGAANAAFAARVGEEVSSSCRMAYSNSRKKSGHRLCYTSQDTIMVHSRTTQEGFNYRNIGYSAAPRSAGR